MTAVEDIQPDAGRPKRKQLKRQNLPAAVVESSDPRAKDCPRLVPEGAKLRKVGKAVLGYDHDPKQPRWKRRSPQQWRSSRRLGHLGLLNWLRSNLGVCHPRPEELVRLVVNALFVRDGTVDLDQVDIYIGLNDRDAITREMIETEIMFAVTGGPVRLIGDGEAGKLANIDLGELLDIQNRDDVGNIVNGVELGRRVEGHELFGLTAPLLTTLSGAKMGKSESGAVWLNAERLLPYDFWQFWRDSTDADVGRFLRLFTELPLHEIARLEALQGSEINEASSVETRAYPCLFTSHPPALSR
jgi:hypothetical protein